MGETVLVTGDVFLQENLFVQTTGGLPGVLDPLTVVPSFGGAGRLADLLRAALGDLQAEVAGPRQPADACRAFVVWAPFERTKGKKNHDKVWRIERHLGAKRCENVGAPAYSSDRIDNPRVLLIEDLNLGFRDDDRLWPDALKTVPDGASVVLRASAPLQRSALWEHLLKGCSDRLTVVVSANALRARGAGLTSPLSWDQAIEEIAAEFEGPRFANDLARVMRVVIQFGADGAASFTRRRPLFGGAAMHPADRVLFEHCLYDPEHLEGAWKARRPGSTSEGTSVLAAALARHELDPANYPLFIALARGLAAIRDLHDRGAGPATAIPGQLEPDFLRASFNPPADSEPEAAFYTAFPHAVLDDATLRHRPASKSDLLGDFLGSGFESVVATGVDIVLRGVEAALKPVPKAVYGKYVTADRDEIERINAIRNLIVAYRENLGDKRPLSFAVFGPPGSGKSFAVKQLMEEIVGKEARSLEFNLSQMEDPGQLHVAFHQVRDESIQNQIPLVFWDEFDTRGLDWLKAFLAPMQDAKFYAAGVQHAFGKAIFVFAGGVASSLVEFPKIDGFKSQKGPDFLSRLRGHIDVKGPNPEPGGSGYTHVIRRAILLRNNLALNAGHLIDGNTRYLAMDPGVARAFLTVDRYKHGARSLEAIVTMSNLALSRFFGPAELPTRDLLDMHVSPDFLPKAQDQALSVAQIESLATATHEAYQRKQSGTPGPTNVPFDRLSPAKRESNRAAVRATLVALRARGYRLIHCTPSTPAPDLPPQAELDLLQPLEHDRWLREVLLSGWAWNETSRPSARLNQFILPFHDLPAAVRPLDSLAVEVLFNGLREFNLALVKP